MSMTWPWNKQVHIHHTKAQVAEEPRKSPPSEKDDHWTVKQSGKVARCVRARMVLDNNIKKDRSQRSHHGAS